jgi:hypothetical protein
MTGWLHISGQVYRGCNVTPARTVIPSIRLYVNEDVEGVEIPVYVFKIEAAR